MLTVCLDVNCCIIPRVGILNWSPVCVVLEFGQIKICIPHIKFYSLLHDQRFRNVIEKELEWYDGHDGVEISGTWCEVLFHLTPTPKSVPCNVRLKACGHVTSWFLCEQARLWIVNSLNCRLKAAFKRIFSLWISHWLSPMAIWPKCSLKGEERKMYTEKKMTHMQHNTDF